MTSGFRTATSASSHDLQLIRLLVNAPLTPRLPLEVLYGVGEVNILTVKARSRQRFVENSAGGSDERLALLVFFVARLLSDKNNASVWRSLTEHGLRATFVEVASRAPDSGRTQFCEGRMRRDQRSCGGCSFARHRLTWMPDSNQWLESTILSSTQCCGRGRQSPFQGSSRA